MRDIAIIVIILGSIPVILARPYTGIMMWCWISYMNPHKLTWGFAYSMPFAAMIAIAVLVGTLFSREPKRIPLTPVTLLLIAFIAWMSITTIFAMQPEDAFETLKRVYKIQLMTFMTLLLMYTKERVDYLVWTIVVSLGFFGIKGGVFTLATGGSYIVWGPPDSFVEGNNELALALLILIPLVNYLRLTVGNRRLKLALAGSMGLMAISAIGSQSRGALVAILSVGFWYWLKTKSKLATGIMAVFFAAIIFIIMPISWHDRMSTIQDYEQDGSAMGRINAWWTGFNVARDRIFGGGFEFWTMKAFAVYAPNPNDFHDAHSIYFEVLGEHGFIGLVIFLAIALSGLLTAGWITKKTRNVKELAWADCLARNCSASLVAYWSGGAFLGLAYYDLYYHIIAILVLTADIVKRDLNKLASVKTSTDGMQVPAKVQGDGESLARDFVRPVRDKIRKY
ncbi:MAG: putative O-glycosylation ligase, exosortase A system-associated [Methylococcales bacterium]